MRSHGHGYLGWGCEELMSFLFFFNLMVPADRGIHRNEFVELSTSKMYSLIYIYIRCRPVKTIKNVIAKETSDRIR